MESMEIKRHENKDYLFNFQEKVKKNTPIFDLTAFVVFK